MVSLGTFWEHSAGISCHPVRITLETNLLFPVFIVLLTPQFLSIPWTGGWRGAPHTGYFSPPQYKPEYQVSPGSKTDEGQQVANPLLGNQLLVDLNSRFLFFFF